MPAVYFPPVGLPAPFHGGRSICHGVQNKAPIKGRKDVAGCRSAGDTHEFSYGVLGNSARSRRWVICIKVFPFVVEGQGPEYRSVTHCHTFCCPSLRNPCLIRAFLRRLVHQGGGAAARLKKRHSFWVPTDARIAAQWAFSKMEAVCGWQLGMFCLPCP